MEFRNYMEELVMEILDDVLRGKKEFCSCERCRLDTIALTLNHLPAKYCVTDAGRAYTKLKTTELQFRTDVVREIVEALKVVRADPRHKQPSAADNRNQSTDDR